MPIPQPLLKPKYPVIDWGNSITQGLVFDAPFSEGAGAIPDDDASIGDTLLGTLAGATWDQNFYGTDLDFSISTSKVVFVGVPAAMQNLTVMSFEFLAFYRSTGGGGLSRVAQKGATTPNSRWMFISGVSGSNQLAFSTAYSTTNGSWNTGGVFPSNGWAHIVLSYDGSSLSNVPILYVNGVQTAIGASTQPVGTWQADDGELNIGNRHDNLRNWDGKIAYFRHWNRLLTSTEAWSLFNNPWQIYCRRNYLPYYVPGPPATGIPNKQFFTNQSIVRASVF